MDGTIVSHIETHDVSAVQQLEDAEINRRNPGGPR